MQGDSSARVVRPACGWRRDTTGLPTHRVAALEVAHSQAEDDGRAERQDEGLVVQRLWGQGGAGNAKAVRECTGPPGSQAPPDAAAPRPRTKTGTTASGPSWALSRSADVASTASRGVPSAAARPRRGRGCVLFPVPRADKRTMPCCLRRRTTEPRGVESAWCTAAGAAPHLRAGTARCLKPQACGAVCCDADCRNSVSAQQAPRAMRLAGWGWSVNFMFRRMLGAGA